MLPPHSLMWGSILGGLGCVRPHSATYFIKNDTRFLISGLVTPNGLYFSSHGFNPGGAYREWRIPASKVNEERRDHLGHVLRVLRTWKNPLPYPPEYFGHPITSSF